MLSGDAACRRIKLEVSIGSGLGSSTGRGHHLLRAAQLQSSWTILWSSIFYLESSDRLAGCREMELGGAFRKFGIQWHIICGICDSYSALECHFEHCIQVQLDIPLEQSMAGPAGRYLRHSPALHDQKVYEQPEDYYV